VGIFNLKDEFASVKFFGTVNQLPGPLEDGILLKVKGVPFLHPQYGFSINVQFMTPVGEGSIKRAAQLLELKLTKEGLFDETRKRTLSYPPAKVGLVTSVGSAAYHDFIKILAERWVGIEIEAVDVQVQGDIAPNQIVSALDSFNTAKDPVDVIVLIRGGGSADDLSAFNTELVTRSVATSRIPTLVAIGHEVDISLAEKAADKRGSTPTHAAEFLAPDKRQVLTALEQIKLQMVRALSDKLDNSKTSLTDAGLDLNKAWESYFEGRKQSITEHKRLLEILSPLNALKRGYAIVRQSGNVVLSGKKLKTNDELAIELADAQLVTTVKNIKLK